MTSPMKQRSDELLAQALETFELERLSPKKPVRENAEVVQVLERAQRYYRVRKEANEALGKAIYRLSLAQKNSIHKLSVDDMREEIEPAVTIQGREDIDGIVDENGNTPVDLDSLSLLSGLPSTEMRIAQKEFKKTLVLLMKSAYAAAEIGV